NILLKEGATLNLHGTNAGGDVNALRLKSDNTGPDTFVTVRAIYGEIDIRSTEITSWDSAAAGPDLNTDNGRAFLAVRSYLAPDGVTPLQSRMDIFSSDIGYLGSHNSEAYGLTWKAAGYGAELHSRLQVYGDVADSRIHHNYFGIYTWGAYGMNIVRNETDNNIGYGIDPHDDSNNLLIEGNYSHDNGWHGIIGSQRCNNIIIRNNVSNNNGKHGIMLHRSSNNGLIVDNIVENNGEMGIAVFESFNATIRNNTVSGNLTGIRFSMGAGDSLVENNRIYLNREYGISTIMGSDPRRSTTVAPRAVPSGGTKSTTTA
ncbi:MAG: right-handed parallel beta-helix repeat-containing protein, partial [Singulisphaera sp.]